ncbi:MAG: putative DNA-binding transcriptional regulator AlpA [Arenicella sp.]|jgi:predicted DNA-binding transcriptional regulator AlpA
MSENSQHPFNDQLNLVADEMGVAMYQRFTLQEGSLFLRCGIPSLEKMAKDHQIRFYELPDGQIEFFGYQLVEYLLGSVSGGVVPTPKSNNPDKIIRIKQVLEMTGLSRTTLWRMERKNEFPKRLPLTAGSVGWRYSEVEKWVQDR